jgi:hypothetical protein
VFGIEHVFFNATDLPKQLNWWILMIRDRISSASHAYAWFIARLIKSFLSFNINSAFYDFSSVKGTY